MEVTSSPPLIPLLLFLDRLVYVPSSSSPSPSPSPGGGKHSGKVGSTIHGSGGGGGGGDNLFSQLPDALSPSASLKSVIVSSLFPHRNLSAPL